MEKDKEFRQILNSGELYDCRRNDFVDYQNQLLEKIKEYNDTAPTPEGMKRRDELLKEMCGTYGEGMYLEPPVHSNWGLKHVHFGKHVYFNFNAVLVDDADIYIGDYTLFGPNVTIVTATHPVSPTLRKYGGEYNKPVHIGNNCWIGAGAIILPGLTIGDNSIIGAGAIVTKDVPADVIVVGNPAHILRPISKKDDEVYDHDKPVTEEYKKYLS